MKNRWYIKWHDEGNDIGADWKKYDSVGYNEWWNLKSMQWRWRTCTATMFFKTFAGKHGVLLKVFQKKFEKFLKEHLTNAKSVIY